MKKKTVITVIITAMLGLGINSGLAAQQISAKDLQLTQMVKQVHLNYNQMIMAKTPNALSAQTNFLLKQPDVARVQRLRGTNLLVTFKTGDKLLMFLGKDRLGSAVNVAQTQQKVIPKSVQRVQKPPLVEKKRRILKPLPRLWIKPCAPESRKALIFDCLEDDANVVTPHAYSQVKSDLQALGYSVTLWLNNSANLAHAALIDNGGYGVVMMRGHGGDLGGDFGFLVRPWYDSLPPANSGYTGTLRASAYNHALNKTMFGYIITQNFSNAYWNNKRFPKTMFFLESCHGADPGALPGMPTWTINHGASVWLGWDESVSFNCGDRGTVLFFDRLRIGNNVGQALAAVHATGCEPPVLVSHPTNKGGCRLSVWASDPNEGSVPNNQDFYLLRLVADGSLHADVYFYDTPNFNSFYFYVDTGGSAAAEILVRCYPDKYEVNKQTSPGLYNNKVYTGTPYKSGKIYSIKIPWNTAFGTKNTIKVWLYNMSVKDRIPNAGSVVVRK